VNNDVWWIGVPSMKQAAPFEREALFLWD